MMYEVTLDGSRIASFTEERLALSFARNHSFLMAGRFPIRVIKVSPTGERQQIAFLGGM